MKKSSRRTLSRLLAGVMLLSSIMGQTVITHANSDIALYADTATSGSAGDVVTSGGAVAGKTYSLDFSSVEAGAALAGTTDESGTIRFVGGSTVKDAAKRADGHVTNVYDGDKIEVDVAGNATITLALCAYGSGTEYVVTDAAGSQVGTIAAKGASDGETASLTYTGEATTLTLTLSATGEAYLHGITVANAALPIGEAESFTFWFDSVATNVDTTNADGTVTSVPTVEPGEYKFADSTVTLIGKGDTKFTNESKDIWTNVAIPNVEGTHNFYKAGQRHATANAIPSIPVAGDGTAVLFAPAAAGTVTVYYQSGSFVRVWDFDTATNTPVNNATGVNYVDDPTMGDYVYAFKAEPGHTYVMSTTGKTNNCAFAGIDYIVDEPVSTPVSTNNINANEASLASLEIYLTDAYLGGNPEATVTTSTSSVALAKGHTYVITTNDGGVKATVNGSDRFVAGAEAIVFDLEDIPDQTLTGTITGTDAGTVTALTFTNQVNGSVVNATINADMTYTAIIKPGEYNTAVTTTNGGVTYDHVSVVQGAENVNEVYVEVPDASNIQYDLPTEIAAASSALTFVSADPAAPIRGNNATSIRASAGDSIVVPVSGVQKITVSGWYAGTWDINGQNSVTTDSSASATSPTTNTYTTNGTETSVTINITGAGANYLYWIKVEDVSTFKAEFNVPGDFDTLTEAVSYINKMADRPAGEDGRVTINMTADIQEQVVFDAPYVTLNGNGHELSWYYGVGTYYYSIDGSTGLYSERLFRDKYNYVEGNGSLWGGVAIVRGDYFIAENTTFRNTYNYWVTEKEVADFAGTTASTFAQRTSTDVDVTVYSAKERSNAFYIEAKNIEIYNCQILSSQDTFGRNGSANNGYSVYVKDSVIGGNTDYICGEFAAIFDNCELQWKTYAGDPSNNGKVGYIVAPKTNPYIFRNCTVTTDGVGEGVLGLYGRTWGASSNCTFIGCETNGLIADTGWAEMTSGDGTTAIFQEYDNYSNGEAFATAGGAAPNKILTEAEAAAYIGDAALTTAYGAGNTWIPVHYSYEEIFRGIWGDVDMSGMLTANDAAAVASYVLDASIASTGRFDFAGADVNADNVIGTKDAAMILQKVLDADFMFPVEPTSETTTEMPIDEANNYVADVEAANTVAGSTVYNGVYASMDTYQNMEFVSDANSAGTIGDKTYAGYFRTTSQNTNVQINGNVKPTGEPQLNAVRVAYIITAKQDVTIDVDCKVNNGKAVYFTYDDATVEGASITTAAGFKNEDADMFTTVSLTIKAGETVYLVGQGTNLPIYGIYFSEPSAAEETTEGTTSEPTDTVDVFIVGDSTGCDYAASTDATLYYKRVGFGTAFPEYLTDSAKVTNLAISGRSSKNFTTEANYQTLLSSMGEGDYLLIAFGHNDEKVDDATRYTEPLGDKDTAGSFKNSLYVNYIQPAIAAGATPILCTPTVRRTDSGTWSASQLHQANGGDYAQCVRDLGTELGLTVIDNTQLTKDLYDTLTPAESVYLHSWSNEASTSVDNTHLNNYGAHYVAYMMADAIAKSTSGLAAYVKADIAAPTKDAYLVVNPGYVPVTADDLTGEALESTLWTTADGWYGTAFGDIGGTDKLYGKSMQVNPETGLEELMTDYTKLAVADTSESGESNFLITGEGTSARVKVGEILSTGAMNSYGKIASTSDGLAMYYMPTSDVNFELSGDITINSYGSHSQVAFGAIAADYILVNENNKTMVQNWVSAGPLKVSGTPSSADATQSVFWSTFARLDGTLTAGTEKSLDTLPAVGSTVHVSIVKKGQDYTVTFGDDVHTFTNVATSGYVYAGFYAARCADISISNISYNNEIVE